MRIDKRITDNLPVYMRKHSAIPDGWLYLGDEKERYVLGQPGEYNLVIFGVNPSTAVPSTDGSKDDQTIRKVRRIVAASDYDGWIMLNLYPQVTKDPDLLDAEADKRLVSGNFKVIQAVFSQYRIGAVLAAWGDLIDKRYYLGEQLVRITDEIDSDCQWYHMGTCTKKGNPRHPLYLKTDGTLEWFPVWDYACSWREI